jgi:preprotein translocase subunit SecA
VVDDVNLALVPRALSHVVITAPRTSAEPPRVQAIAASFRRGSDYRPERRQQAILFTASAMSRLKAVVGWDEVPSLEAVAMAERVENAIVRRAGLGRSDGREPLTEISVQGYLAAYEALTGFSSRGGEPGRSVDDLLSVGGRGAPHPRELAFERLIDGQRSKLYDFRARARDEPDALRLVRPIASDAVREWLAGGAETPIAGLRDALAGRSRERIDDALSGPTTHDEFADRATRLIEKAVEERANVLGTSEMAALLRKVLLTLVDVRWREHLLRVRFLQRQAAALYHPAAEAAGAREADVVELFAACEQAIRIESIRYALNAAAVIPAEPRGHESTQ